MALPQAVEHPLECPWLPAKETILLRDDRFDHSEDISLPDLPAVAHLERELIQAEDDGGLKTEAIRTRDEFHASMVHEWDMKVPRIPDDPGPLLIDEDWCLLGLFELFDLLFFDNDLQDVVVEISWCDVWNMPPGKRGLTTVTVEDAMRIQILRPNTADLDGFFSGNDALQIMSTVLHEMCHAQERFYCCYCDSCKAVAHRLGVAEHGNFWLYLAGLVEALVNDWFGDWGHWKLDVRKAHREESRYRLIGNP